MSTSRTPRPVLSTRRAGSLSRGGPNSTTRGGRTQYSICGRPVRRTAKLGVRRECGDMPQVDNLLGSWKPESMAAPGAQVYDVLTFRNDGTGFLDFSSPETRYFCEHFRWSVNAVGHLHLRGTRVHRYKPNGTDIVDSPSTLNADVSFSVRTEHTRFGRETRVLRIGTCPWSAVADPASVATHRY